MKLHDDSGALKVARSWRRAVTIGTRLKLDETLSAEIDVKRQASVDNSKVYGPVPIPIIRLHILHRASEREFFGLWMIEQLGQHAYKLSAGTMYPLLQALEK